VLTQEQITALVAAVIGLLQVITIAIGIWNKQHIAAVSKEQTRVAEELSKVQQNGKALNDMLSKHQ